MKIRKSAEDYLEAILVLSKQGGGVRSIDIATMLGVSKPSVSHAMKLLREDGYIAMDRYGTVTLLDKGTQIAEHIYERHTVLSKMLERLGVSPEVAIFALQDSFGTACNITGDGALTLILTGYAKKHHIEEQHISI